MADPLEKRKQEYNPQLQTLSAPVNAMRPGLGPADLRGIAGTSPDRPGSLTTTMEPAGTPVEQLARQGVSFAGMLSDPQSKELQARGSWRHKGAVPLEIPTFDTISIGTSGGSTPSTSANPSALPGRTTLASQARAVPTAVTRKEAVPNVASLAEQAGEALGSGVQKRLSEQTIPTSQKSSFTNADLPTGGTVNRGSFSSGFLGGDRQIQMYDPRARLSGGVPSTGFKMIDPVASGFGQDVGRWMADKMNYKSDLRKIELLRQQYGIRGQLPSQRLAAQKNMIDANSALASLEAAKAKGSAAASARYKAIAKSYEERLKQLHERSMSFRTSGMQLTPEDMKSEQQANSAYAELLREQRQFLESAPDVMFSEPEDTTSKGE